MNEATNRTLRKWCLPLFLLTYITVNMSAIYQPVYTLQICSITMTLQGCTSPTADHLLGDMLEIHMTKPGLTELSTRI